MSVAPTPDSRARPVRSPSAPYWQTRRCNAPIGINFVPSPCTPALSEASDWVGYFDGHGPRSAMPRDGGIVGFVAAVDAGGHPGRRRRVVSSAAGAANDEECRSRRKSDEDMSYRE